MANQTSNVITALLKQKPSERRRIFVTMFPRKENKVLYSYVTLLYFTLLYFGWEPSPFFANIFFFSYFFILILEGRVAQTLRLCPLALEGGNLLHPLPWTLAWTGNKRFMSLSLLFARSLLFYRQ